MRASASVLFVALAWATTAWAQDSTAVDQISSPSAPASSDQAQLTPQASSNQQPAQVSKAAPNAQAPQPLSRPEEGRTAAVARVQGKDRCDSAEPARRNSDECKHVIESRAADYERPKGLELSPEQKLLLDQEALSAETAGQKLAKSGDPDKSLDAMGIASIVLTQSQPEESKKPDPDTQTDAAIQSIINVIAGQPPK